ncbi:hypothetical protein WME97_35960 [Sorangium sp. So ce367]|uniref:hypothetical protein n=1 Tax=Sorangium sp. So ce367 TaxID=3133305 RepID=UPI003F5D79DD
MQALSNSGALARHSAEANGRSLEMCPACIAAAAVTVAKVASAGGLVAYGIKKLLTTAGSPALALPPSSSGKSNETTEDRIPR